MAQQTGLQPKQPLDLASAMVLSSHTPLILLDDNLSVVMASMSFCRAFEINPSSVSGRMLTELGDGEWNVPQLRSLLKATAAGHADIEAYEMDLIRDGHENRCLVINAQRLDYADSHNVRLLLAVLDVTALRASEKIKDAALRDKAVLLQEIQHRVANSLQIIASVLMQSARRTQSEEARSHLHDAHQRVMSVAAMQRQLAVTQEGEVKLRSYFTDLCQSIAASMIRDPAQVLLEVTADNSAVSADVSMSLGLVVTELVINAIKHAFPDHRRGTIKVTYQAKGDEWTLTVADDGVGMIKEPATAKAGLGTSIIGALARQLRASIVVTDAKPGVQISIVHASGATAVYVEPMQTQPAI